PHNPFAACDLSSRELTADGEPGQWGQPTLGTVCAAGQSSIAETSSMTDSFRQWALWGATVAVLGAGVGCEDTSRQLSQEAREQIRIARLPNEGGGDRSHEERIRMLTEAGANQNL